MIFKEIYTIDWRRDGNLLAYCGEGGSVKIFGRREGKIVRSFDNLHTGSE